MVSGATAGLIELLTQFRVGLFAGGLILMFALLYNAATNLIPVPKQHLQPLMAAIILISISFIWVFTDGGWAAIFDRISFLVLSVAVGGLVVYHVLDGLEVF